MVFISLRFCILFIHYEHIFFYILYCNYNRCFKNPCVLISISASSQVWSSLIAFSFEHRSHFPVSHVSVPACYEWYILDLSWSFFYWEEYAFFSFSRPLTWTSNYKKCLFAKSSVCCLDSASHMYSSVSVRELGRLNIWNKTYSLLALSDFHPYFSATVVTPYSVCTLRLQVFCVFVLSMLTGVCPHSVPFFLTNVDLFNVCLLFSSQVLSGSFFLIFCPEFIVVIFKGFVQ